MCMYESHSIREYTIRTQGSHYLHMKYLHSHHSIFLTQRPSRTFHPHNTPQSPKTALLKSRCQKQSAMFPEATMIDYEFVALTQLLICPTQQLQQEMSMAAVNFTASLGHNLRFIPSNSNSFKKSSMPAENFTASLGHNLRFISSNSNLSNKPSIPADNFTASLGHIRRRIPPFGTFSYTYG
jgi:hypothetical protein